MNRIVPTHARLGFAALAFGCAACVPHAELEVAPNIASAHWSQPDAGPAAANVAGASSAPATGPMPADLGIALHSAELSALITRAAGANTDIRIAGARIRQARALLRVARGAMLPV